MKKIISTILITFCVITSYSQVYFSVDNILLNPDNPTTQDSVKIVLSGYLSSTGVYIDTVFYEIIDNEIFISVDCNTTGGFQMLIDHEEIINLGLLPIGNYQIHLSGTFLGDNISDPDQYFFSVTDFTGLYLDNSINNELIIFPNPSNGVFYIDDDNFVNIDIFNNVGEFLFRIEQNNKIDIKRFPDGVYHTKIYKNRQVFYKKLIKK